MAQSDEKNGVCKANMTTSLTNCTSAFCARFYFALACAFFALSAYSDNLGNPPVDLVSFFKRAIDSPPDVESFAVSQRDIKSDRINFYVGARAGTNFFLQILSTSNALKDLNQRGLIAGQSRAGSYEFSRNAVSFGTGSNSLTGGVGMLLSLTRQFLDMGLGNVKPESVKWSGDKFTALDNFGKPQYGELKISNGLPSSLEIRNAMGPYSLVEYVYPSPPAYFNGFPSKLLLFEVNKGKLDEDLEVLFSSVQLATRPLDDDYFSAAQFVVSNILYTNIYQDANLYVQNRHHQMVKIPSSVRRSAGYASSHARIVIFICLALVTIVPVSLLIFQHKKQINQRE